MPPKVTIIDQILPLRTSDAEELAEKIRKVVKTLDDHKAWPQESGKFEIRIVNAKKMQHAAVAVAVAVAVGDTDSKTSIPTNFNDKSDAKHADGEDSTEKIFQEDPELSVIGIETRWHCDRNAPLGKIRRDRNRPMYIAVSVDLLTAGVGHDLLDLGADEIDVLIHLLGHEIHHLNEAERLIDCGVEPQYRHNGLTKSIRGDLPSQWREAIKLFGIEHRSSASGLDPILLKTCQVADEACADLTGLHWLRTTTSKWKAYSKLLIHFRRRELACYDAASLSPRPYDIADEIDRITSGSTLPPLHELQSRTCDMAITIALASPLLHPEVAKAFMACTPPVTLETRSPKKNRSFIDKLLRR